MADKWTQLTNQVNLTKQLAEAALQAQRYTLQLHLNNYESILLAHRPEILKQPNGETVFAQLQTQLEELKTKVQNSYANATEAHHDSGKTGLGHSRD